MSGQAPSARDRSFDRIRLLSGGKPQTVLSLLREAGLDFDAPCGGQGVCGNCIVKAKGDLLAPTQREIEGLTAHGLAAGFRLACQAEVSGAATVFLRREDEGFRKEALDEKGATVISGDWYPAIHKEYLQLHMPSLSDVTADFQRIENALGHRLTAPVDVMRRIPSAVRANNGKVTAVLYGDPDASGGKCILPKPLFNDSNALTLVCLEAGDTRRHLYGAAVDIGTTTIAGYLWDFVAKKKVAVYSRTNPQSAFGADILSRIAYAQEGAGDLRLQRAVLGGVFHVITGLADKARISPHQIYEVVLVGNTCMQHLFFRFDTKQLGLSPYIAANQQLLSLTLSEITGWANYAGSSAFNVTPGVPHAGLSRSTSGSNDDLKPDISLSMSSDFQGQKGANDFSTPETPAMCGAQAAVYTFLPVIAGFVGADTVGCILALGMDEQEDISLMIDLGTNAEIVIGSRKKLITCSAAAGPAFEGARIDRGMRASPGAIDGVWFKDRYVYHVFGGEKPSGICGSGLVDAVAMLASHGIIDGRGRIQDNPLAPEELRRRVVRECAHTREAPGEESASLQGISSNSGENARVFEEEGQPAFVLAWGEESRDGKDLLLTQKDIREVQLAKGAIACGIRILMKELGVSAQDISRIFLAGAFGNYINPKSAQRIGILPAGVPLERVFLAGNAAGIGAQMALVSQSARKRTQEIAERVEHLELALHPDFLNGFTDGMYF